MTSRLERSRFFVAEPVPTLNGASVTMTRQIPRSARNDIKGGGTPQNDRVVWVAPYGIASIFFLIAAIVLSERCPDGRASA